MSAATSDGVSTDTVWKGWIDRAEALRDWAKIRCLNRRDVYGDYAADGSPYTAKDGLTDARHLASWRGERPIGLHAISPTNTCKWVAVDIDAHDASDVSGRNLKFAKTIIAKARERFGLRGVIFDSDGKGGLHVVFYFAAEVPSPIAHWLAKWLVADFAAHGFSTPPEAFPKQPRVTLEHPYGSWLRHPGRKPNRPHWTMILERIDKNRWLVGEGAAKLLLAIKGDDVSHLNKAYQEADEDKDDDHLVIPVTRTPHNGDHVSEDVLRSALAALPASIAEDYDAWLVMGMAIQDSFSGANGLSLWKEFSSKASNYDEASCDAKWNTFTPGGGVTVGTIFGSAKEHGWKRPGPRLRQIGSKGQAEANGTAGDKKPARPIIANFATVVDKTDPDAKPIDYAISIAEIDTVRLQAVGDWPKRVGSALFVEGQDYAPQYLDSTEQTFAYFLRSSHVAWKRLTGATTQAQYHEHLRMTTTHYDAVELQPHFPPMPGTYYMHRPLPTATGKHLKAMLDHFRPATEVDRDLILAYVLTLFWGGPPGQRPGFLVEGPEEDEKQGRGVGKSFLVQAIADGLTGGSLDVQPSEDIATVKTRLLSPDAVHNRVCRLDNVKTMRLSWGDLEGLVTASSVSGRALYRGEGRRPNTLIWTFTLNGARLSRDMAQRVIPIRLDRPRYVAAWEGLVRDYIATHRWDIIADVGAILSLDPPAIQPETRWARWEADVLAHVSDRVGCQKVILSRQAAMDDDEAERDIVRDYIVERLRERGVGQEKGVAFIPTAIMAEWVGRATGEKRPVNRASSYLAGLGIRELRSAKAHGGERGWRWQGPDANRNDTPFVVTSAWLSPVTF